MPNITEHKKRFLRGKLFSGYYFLALDPYTKKFGQTLYLIHRYSGVESIFQIRRQFVPTPQRRNPGHRPTDEGGFASDDDIDEAIRILLNLHTR